MIIDLYTLMGFLNTSRLITDIHSVYGKAGGSNIKQRVSSSGMHQEPIASGQKVTRTQIPSNIHDLTSHWFHPLIDPFPPKRGF